VLLLLSSRYIPKRVTIDRVITEVEKIAGDPGLARIGAYSSWQLLLNTDLFIIIPNIL
jgi:hypothetical protein